MTETEKALVATLRNIVQWWDNGGANRTDQPIAQARQVLADLDQRSTP